MVCAPNAMLRGLPVQRPVNFSTPFDRRDVRGRDLGDQKDESRCEAVQALQADLLIVLRGHFDAPMRGQSANTRHIEAESVHAQSHGFRAQRAGAARRLGEISPRWLRASWRYPDRMKIMRDVEVSPGGDAMAPVRLVSVADD